MLLQFQDFLYSGTVIFTSSLVAGIALLASLASLTRYLIYFHVEGPLAYYLYFIRLCGFSFSLMIIISRVITQNLLLNEDIFYSLGSFLGIGVLGIVTLKRWKRPHSDAI